MSQAERDARAAIDGLCASITPASRAQALGAERALAPRKGGNLELFERLAIWLAAARHAPRPATANKRVIVVAADHGVADPGVDLGGASPTAAALAHIDAGRGPLCAAARSAGATIALVDAGVWGDPGHIPGLIDLRAGAGTADITAGPAMSTETTTLAIASGVALLFSLAEDGLDVAALGALGAGSEVASTATIASLSGSSPSALGGPDAPDADAALSTNAPDRASPIDVVASVGGFDIAVLAGVILAATAIAVPIVIDDHVTGAAALAAAALAPDVRDYVLASHAGSHPAHQAALEALALRVEPLLSVGLARGDGAGAALALPALDAAAAHLRGA